MKVEMILEQSLKYLNHLAEKGRKYFRSSELPGNPGHKSYVIFFLKRRGAIIPRSTSGGRKCYKINHEILKSLSSETFLADIEEFNNYKKEKIKAGVKKHHHLKRLLRGKKEVK